MRKLGLLKMLKMRSVVSTWSLVMILRMTMMILTACSCSLLASVACIALDQFDRVFSGFSIFDWDFDQLDRVVSGLPPLVWDLDQTGCVLSGLPFIFILSDQADRVLSGLSKLNLGLVILSGLAIPFLVSLFLLTFQCLVKLWVQSDRPHPDRPFSSIFCPQALSGHLEIFICNFVLFNFHSMSLSHPISLCNI